MESTPELLEKFAIAGESLSTFFIGSELFVVLDSEIHEIFLGLCEVEVCH
jgi:hypothetical protein